MFTLNICWQVAEQSCNSSKLVTPAYLASRFSSMSGKIQTFIQRLAFGIGNLCSKLPVKTTK